MKKIAFVFNMAPKYNEEFYLTIDKNIDCTFIIGEQIEDIKEMDLSLLCNCVKSKRHKIIGPVSYDTKVLKSVLTHNYTDIITTLDPYSITLWIMKIICLLKGINVYYITHGWYGKESGIKKIIKKVDYLTTKGYFLYGNYAKDVMIKNGLNANKLEVIHNSINYSKQISLRSKLSKTDIYTNHFRNTYPVLLFIGRLTPVKQLDMLIEAVKKLKVRGEEYNLIFIGDGSERERLQKITEINKVQDNVWFYGACYDEETIGELIYNADLCVAPGNIGLTAMHVMVFGTPALTHNDFAWQMPEFEAIHEGVTGSFFDRGNIDSMVNAISQWFRKNKNNREDVRLACYREIDENWTPEFELNVLKKTLNIK